jgi:putative membrane protein
MMRESAGMGVGVALPWTFSPVVLILAGAVLTVYVRRWRAVRSSASRPSTEAPVWRLCCFVGAVVAVLAALISPLDALADDLFFVHMVQHILLLDVAPILAILGFTKVILRPVTRAVSNVERKAGVIAHPAFAVFAYVAVIWAWHIPAAYDLAVRDSEVHVIEHTSFLIVGSLYWWHLLSPIRTRYRLTGLGPVAYMVATKLLVGLLGILLAFAPTVIYPYYAGHPHYWGLSPHTDQSMAGLVMALEQSVVMGIALVVVFVRMLTESEREQQRRERFEVA